MFSEDVGKTGNSGEMKGELQTSLRAITGTAEKKIDVADTMIMISSSKHRSSHGHSSHGYYSQSSHSQSWTKHLKIDSEAHYRSRKNRGSSAEDRMLPYIKSPPSEKVPSLLLVVGASERWFFNPDILKMSPKAFGSGSVANVFHGRVNGTPVVVKELKNRKKYGDEEDIRKEIALLRILRHPNIINFIGATYDPVRGVRILLESMDGGDLRRVVRTAGGESASGLSKKRTLDISLGIARALAWLHGADILHRDLKPANILFTQEGVPKLGDFGLGRYKDPRGIMSPNTGTLRFMAPEILLKKRYGTNVDVYSFGLILYYMITGSLPFTNYNRKQRINHAKNGKEFTTTISSQRVDRAIYGIIKVCTVHDCETRIESPKLLERIEALNLETMGQDCCTIS
mmetsp:Transcript_22752/g.40258  ORF Transcript_22752/g.40258 Transcript_22752/m.40258 type:complete len:400 (-) Transcript_22752:198-1397(-)